MTAYDWNTPHESLSGFAAYVVSPVEVVEGVSARDAELRVGDPLSASFWTLYGLTPCGRSTALHDASDEDALVAALRAAREVWRLPVAYCDAVLDTRPRSGTGRLADALTTIILDDIEADAGQGGPAIRRDDDFDNHPLTPLREALLS